MKRRSLYRSILIAGAGAILGLALPFLIEVNSFAETPHYRDLRLAVDTDNPVLYRETLKRIPLFRKKSREFRFQNARWYFRRGAYEEAESILRELWLPGANEPPYLFLLARLKRQQGRPAAALDILDQIEKSFLLQQVLLQKAEIYRELGDTPQADQTFQKALLLREPL